MQIQDAQEFYSQHFGKPFFKELCDFICSDFVVGLELISDDCINRFKTLVGPTNCQVCFLLILMILLL